MNGRTIGYWICTGLVAAMLTMSAAMTLTSNPEAIKGTEHLGYPRYFMYLLGTWYALRVAALLAPGFALLKEWAYAGIMFAFTSAVVSHLASGDGLAKASSPVVALLILAGSYFLRPASRRVAAAPATQTPG